MKEKARKTGKKEASFEQALEGLEEIVQRLEGGELPLEESLELFEKGVLLTRVCSERLEAAEKKIEVLMRDAGGGIESRAADPAAYARGTDDDEGEAPPG